VIFAGLACDDEVVYNESMNVQEIARVLALECRLTKTQPLVVGVSGGPDSLCLLDVLLQLGYPLAVAHLDHALRTESAAEAQQVEAFARKCGVPFVIEREDVWEVARCERLSIEEAARMVRYRFLFAQAERFGAQAVAVAHTADDQVETVLMHLLRGAGLAGLCGMSYRSKPGLWGGKLPLVRPLLGVWRSEVLEYCQQQGLQPSFDLSNRDRTFFRNRLRLELIPYLTTYNPQVKGVLWRMAQALRGDYEVLQEVTRNVWERCCLRDGGDFVCLSLTELQRLSAGLQRSVMRQAVAHLRPSLRDIDFRAVEKGLSFLAEPVRGRAVDWVAGLRLYLEDERMFVVTGKNLPVEADWPQVEQGIELPLRVPGRLSLLQGWVIEADLLEVEKVEELLSGAGKDAYQAWLDADSLTMPLFVRSRKVGDRFEPLGLGGHTMKLSDFWINAGLSVRARPGWALVCSGKKIAWIPGFRPAHFCRLTDQTRRVVHLICYRETDS